MSTDRYRTLASAGTGQLREKASRFIGFAFPMADEEAFKQCMQEFMKVHHGARHFCYVWVLGDTANATERMMQVNPQAPQGSLS
jgi:putative IMPACT (imprinted ancient) family translation regulator